MHCSIKFKEIHQKLCLVTKKNDIMMNENKIINIRRSQDYNIKLYDYYIESTMGENGLKQKKWNM